MNNYLDKINKPLGIRDKAIERSVLPLKIIENVLNKKHKLLLLYVYIPAGMM